MTIKTIAVILFVSVVAAAQQTESLDPICNKDFALTLVDQQVSSSSSLRDASKRARILMRSADFIWPYHEPRSREYFTAAMKAATEDFREKAEEEKKSTAQFFQTAPDLRFDVIRAVAKRDSEWARRLINDLMEEFEKVARDRNEANQSREIGLMLDVAHENIKRDPDLSWYLYRRAMRYPVAFHWYVALYRAAGTDASLAAALYRELMQVYRNEPPRRMLLFSAFPFANDRIFGVDKYSYGMTIPAGVEPDHQLQQLFLTTFLTRVSGYTREQIISAEPGGVYRQPETVYMVSALSELEPIVTEQHPALLPMFSLAKANALSLVDDDARKGLEQSEERISNFGMTFDERLQKLDEADELGTLKDVMIVMVAGTNIRQDDQFRRLEPWLAKIKDDKARAQTVSHFWFQRSSLAIEQRRLRDSEDHATKVPESEFRALLVFKLAEAQLKDTDDRIAVMQTLNNVRQIVEKMEDSPTKVRLTLGLASKYAEVNRESAISELAEAVRIANRLKEPDLFSSSINRAITGAGFGHYVMYSLPGHDLEGTFRELSTDDHDLPLSNARALVDEFLRTVAVIAVAGNCIDKAPLTDDDAEEVIN